jgi:hypothetical protein
VLSKISKISLVILCVYIIFTKIYVAVYHTPSDITVRLNDFIVCCSCISLSFIVFRKTGRIKYAFIFIPFLLFAIYTQTVIEGFNALSQREDVIYPGEYLWIYDIPNLLSIFIMICLLVLTIIKNKKI